MPTFTSPRMEKPYDYPTLDAKNGRTCTCSVHGRDIRYASAFISDPNWTSGIDAALDTTTAGKIYFFKGSHYSRFTDARVDSGYPVLMPGGWRGLPPSWSSGIDAAVAFAPTTKIYLFKGNQYVRLTGTQVDPGYPLRLPGGWRGLPTSWHSGIDAALDHEPTQKMVLLQRQSVRLIDGRRSRSRVSGGAAWRLEGFTRSVVVGYRRRGLPSRPHLLLQGQSVRAVHRYAVGRQLSPAAPGWVAVQAVVSEQLHATPSSHRRRRLEAHHFSARTGATNR